MSHTSTAPSLSRVNSNLAEDGTSPILLQSKSWVLDQHGQASALLQRSLSMARTPKESSLVTGVKEIMDSIIKHHVTLSGKYETELLKMRNAMQDTAASQKKLTDYQQKLHGLNLDQWGDQFKLKSDIAAMEGEIRNLANVNDLRPIHYDASLPPVANLVFHKFARLEEVVFLLKKKIANLMESSLKQTGNGGAMASMFSTGTTEPIVRENANLKERNKQLLLLLKQARNSLAAQNKLVQNRAGPVADVEVNPDNANLEPGVLSFLCSFDNLLQSIFSSFASGPPMFLPSASLEQLRKSNNTATKEEMVKFAKEYELVPQLISKTQFLAVFDSVTKESTGNESAQPTTFYEFKRFVAHLGLVIYSQEPWNKRYPSQTEKVAALAKELDMTHQHRCYMWDALVKRNKSGVLLFLNRYERIMRQLFMCFCKPIEADSLQPELQYPDTVLRMDQAGFLCFARGFGILPELLTEDDVIDVFYASAVSNTFTDSYNRDPQVRDEDAIRFMVYPDFKQSLARLAMRANPNFPSLDAKSHFAKQDDSSFDPTMIITGQFLNFLQITDNTEWEMVNSLDAIIAKDKKRNVLLESGSVVAANTGEADKARVDLLVKRNAHKLRCIFDFFAGGQEILLGGGQDRSIRIKELHRLLQDFRIMPHLVSSSQVNKLFEANALGSGKTAMTYKHFIAFLKDLSLALPGIHSDHLGLLFNYLRLRDLDNELLQGEVDDREEFDKASAANPFGARPRATRKDLEKDGSNAMIKHNNSTFCLFKPDVVSKKNEQRVLRRIRDAGFNVADQAQLTFTKPQAKAFLSDYIEHDQFKDMVEFLCSGPSVAIVLEKKHCDVVEELQLLSGPEDPAVARKKQPDSLRALFGSDVVKNGVHISASHHDAAREIQLIFNDFVAPIEKTFCFIKPDAVKKKLVDPILARLKAEGFSIEIQEMICLTDEQIREFFATRVDMPTFSAHLRHISSGPMVALSLVKNRAVGDMFKLCGPEDPEEARKNAPNSLHSLYGTNFIQNAVHCSATAAQAEREHALVFDNYSADVCTTFAWLKPDLVAMGKTAEAMDRIKKAGFQVVMEEVMFLTKEQVNKFFADHVSKPWFSKLVKLFTSGRCIALALRKRFAIEELQKLAGPEDPADAISKNRDSIRAQYGKDEVSNAIYCSSSQAVANREIDVVFSEFSVGVQETFAWIKPDALHKKDEIIEKIKEAGFEIARQQQMHLTATQTTVFFARQAHLSHFPLIVENITSGPMLALTLRMRNAVLIWSIVCGPEDPKVARKNDPYSLRAMFGTDIISNALHCSTSVQDAQREISLVYGQLSLEIQTTFCWIKPDAVAAGYVDEILNYIHSENFEVVQQMEHELTTVQARKFYADQASSPHFAELIAFMTSGPSIALALRKEEGVAAFAKVSGVEDPARARAINPNCLRAVYGTDNMRNAVHFSANKATAKRELDMVFEGFLKEEIETFALIHPDQMGAKHEILQCIAENKLKVVKMEEINLKPKMVKEFFAELADMPEFPALITHLTSGPSLALGLKGLQAVKKWNDICGPADPSNAKLTAARSLRALYGTDTVKNAVYASATLDSARKELDLFFRVFVVAGQSTFAWIKPNAMAKREEIISRLKEEGYEIVEQKERQLTAAQVLEFYRAEKNEKHYPELKQELCSNTVLALWLRKDNAIVELNKLAGPELPKDAKATAPNSLRALYGDSLVRNGIHISKDKEAARRELKLVFEVFKADGQLTFAWIKPDAVKALRTQEILDRIESEGFTIARKQTMRLTAEQVAMFYPDETEKSTFPALQLYMTSGPVVALLLKKADAVKDWLELVGPTSPAKARKVAPTSLRALMGTDLMQNAVHASATLVDGAKEAEMAFSMFMGVGEEAFCWIKPDAVQRGHTEAIIARFREEGFDIIRHQNFRLSLEQAETFFEEHKGRKTYQSMIDVMISGICVGMVLKKDSAIKELKAVCGPENSVVARKTHPRTIRALYGLDTMKNAVYCSESAFAARRATELAFEKFSVGVQNTLALIKPEAVRSGQANAIITRLRAEGFEILLQDERQFNDEQAYQLYSEHAHQPYFTALIKHMTSGPVVALKLRKENAVLQWKDLCGPTNPKGAKKADPRCLRAMFGLDIVQNAVHGSSSKARADEELAMVFEKFAIGDQTTFAWIKPDAISYYEDIVKFAEDNGFEVLDKQLTQLTMSQAHSFYADQSNDTGFTEMCNFMTSGPCMALSLRKNNGIKSWLELCGPANSKEAQENKQGTLRATYGTDLIKNAVHGSKSLSVAARELDLVFKGFLVRSQVTFAWIKPDVLRRHLTDRLLESIKEHGFEILAKDEMQLNRDQVELFYDQHKSKPYFKALVDQMVAGPCIALSLSKENAILDWKKLVGPADPDVARKEEPHSMRAVFGEKGAANAVHAAANPEAVQRELEQVFVRFQKGIQTTFGFLKPNLVEAGHAPKVLERLKKEGFAVDQHCLMQLTIEQAKKFYGSKKDLPEFDELIKVMTQGPVLALQLTRKNAISHWKMCCGPTDPMQARWSHPKSLRALYGEDILRNACHASDDEKAAQREGYLVFKEYTRVLDTFCLIKPKAVKDGHANAIVNRLKTEGFQIVRRERMHLTNQQAMRFYASHSGEVHFLDLLDFITSGPVYAIRARRSNAVGHLRLLAGPTDSSEARRSAPNSLRALYGLDRQKNAVHASVCESVAERELAMVFGNGITAGFSVGLQKTFAWIKADIVANDMVGVVLAKIKEEGFQIEMQDQLTLTAEQVEEFYSNLPPSQQHQLPGLVENMTSGPVIALCLSKDNAVMSWNEVCGPAEPKEARKSAPNSLRALYGTDLIRNCVHASADAAAAEREIDLIFFDMFAGEQTTLAVIKPNLDDEYHNEIRARLKEENFEIVEEKTFKFTVDMAKEFWAAESENPLFEESINYLASGPMTFLKIKGKGAVKRWFKMMGPVDSDEARAKQPGCLRAICGADDVENAVHGPPTIADAEREMALVFDKFFPSLETTLAIIKPFAVSKGADEEIIQVLIEKGFHIEKEKRLTIDAEESKTFYDASKDTKDFKNLVSNLSSGDSIVLALTGPNAVAWLNELCGPVNPAEAKKTHPATIRAVYGKDQIKNAIHCSATSADALREIDQMFKEAEAAAAEGADGQENFQS